jgi:hypothetical protein
VDRHEPTHFNNVDHVTSRFPAKIVDVRHFPTWTRVRRAGSGTAHRILAGGALRTGYIAPLLAAGVRAFHTGTGVRRDATWSTPVDLPWSAPGGTTWAEVRA